MFSKKNSIDYNFFKRALNLIGLEPQQLRFTTTGNLKELCLNGIWYVVNQQKRFTNHLKKVVKTKIRDIKTISKNLPKWLSLRPQIQLVVNN